MNLNWTCWTLEEETKLAELVIAETHSLPQIGRLLNKKTDACIYKMRKLGLNSNYIRRTYSHDENFWSIPNITNVIYGGFSSADACVFARKGKYHEYRLEIQKSDEEYLKQFVRDCKFTGPIMENIRKERNSHTVSFTVISNKWAEDLNKNFNIMPNKTQRLAPPEHLGDDLMCYWLKGYTDGDGCVYPHPTTGIQLTYSSSSQYMMEWIKKFTDKMWPTKLSYNREAHPWKHEIHNCWHYEIGGIRASVIVDYLTQLPGPTLNRKWLNPKTLEIIRVKN